MKQTLHSNRLPRGTGNDRIFFLLAWSALLVLTLGGPGAAAQEAAPQAAVFPAWSAKVTGNLRIQGMKEAASIHYWNQADDTIRWIWADARPGRYLAEIQYSLDQSMGGGKMALTVGNQRLVVPAEPTGKWTLFQTFKLGVLNVENDGDLPVILQAAQLPQASNAALPDVAWLSLSPTDVPVTRPATPASSKPGEFHGKRIFDGKTFDGWEGDLNWFRIEDRAVVAGGLTKSIPENEFLATTRDYADFELRLKARLTDGKGNGGVQFRSQRVKDSREMIGYQADVAGSFWGGVYDESRRRHFLGQRLNEKEMRAALKPADWNAYVIRCEGPRVRVWVNDVLTLDYTEPDQKIPRTGKIGLQIHSGEPAEAWYKDVEIEELKPAQATARPAFGETPRSIDEATSARFEALGWKVGIQSYTFTKYTLFEAIDAASALGLQYVEATTWQRIEPGSDQNFNPWWMSAETKQKIKDYCKEKGVTIISFYCRPSKEDIEKQSPQVEKIFQFCKEMNISLTTDPVRVKSGFASMEFYDDLCKKYGVRMFLTNHPRSHGSPYWNPDDVLADCEGRSEYIGGSVDVGHFMRDGTDVYEAVKKYTDAGRMAHFHFRDVDKRASDGKDVTLGEGVASIGEALQYMHEKGAKPILVFEYERDQNEPLKYIIPSLEVLKAEAAKLKP